jgi:hypothetical protein
MTVEVALRARMRWRGNGRAKVVVEEVASWPSQLPGLNER